MKRLFVVSLLLVGTAALADEAKKAPNEKYFYVYHDKADRQNHYIPSGWMGDWGDLKLNDNFSQDVEDGRTCIEWTYNAQSKQGANWSGVFWQIPANNWGDKPGGYDLTGFKRLTFWAKGDHQIQIAEFKVGGITGEHGDSDAVSLSGVALDKKWRKFTIDLASANLSHIVGAFAWSASRDDNPDGFKLYLDEVRFER